MTVHVLHVITKGDVGGAQTHVVELATAQLAAGLRVSVVAGTGGPALERCAEAGCHTAVLEPLGRARSQIRQRDALRAFAETVMERSPDVVHAHSSNAGFVARIACRRIRVPCVYTAHGWPFQRGAALRQRVLSLAGELVAGRLGDAVICLTEAEARRARRAFVARRDRLWVIPNGLADVSPELVHHHDADAVPGVVMVARFAPPKRQRELVDVMARMADLPWTLTFVGDGPELEECARHGELALGDRVRFLGHRDDVTELLAEQDVLVLWSAYEGLPISVLEGMRAGLCCLGSDLPGMHELLGADGGLTAPDAEGLADVLRTVLTDPALRTALGAAARRRFVERFTAGAVEEHTRAVYAAVIDRARPRARAGRSTG